ncbi:iron-containing alcohol dehydrogenase [Pseudomonas sp. ML96]|uniref:iron-containing alcohol dehydrogenase n=1 Tax=Pseudomonas sp. ML96 TaxID=1523503 RepID=UPI0005B9BAF5|nr:iron-containing alcohol dehydrogenase [Pseudomonas sp. ML96]
MRNFSYYNPTRILFGAGQIAGLAQQIPAGSRVLVTHGGGSILQNGVWQEVEQALAAYRVTRFAGIEANPQYSTLLRAAELARRTGCDFILAVGGGSVIDGSKFIAAVLAYPGEPFDLLCGTPIRRALPLGCVATLAASGSECNPHGVLGHADLQARLAFSSPCLYPRFAILDPCTTFSLPPRQIGNGVVASFVHTLEQYLSFPANTPLQDRQAEGLLLTLLEEGPKAVANPLDYASRANLMWCASQARSGLLACGSAQDDSLGLLGRQLSLLYHLDHAQSLALLLPALLGEYRAECLAKQLQYAERVWGLRHGGPEQRIAAAIRATEGFFRRMGVATRLSAHGLDAEAIPEVLAQLQRRDGLEQPPIDLEACERILLRAL